MANARAHPALLPSHFASAITPASSTHAIPSMMKLPHLPPSPALQRAFGLAAPRSG